MNDPIGWIFEWSKRIEDIIEFWGQCLEIPPVATNEKEGRRLERFVILSSRPHQSHTLCVLNALNSLVLSPIKSCMTVEYHLSGTVAGRAKWIYTKKPLIGHCRHLQRFEFIQAHIQIHRFRHLSALEESKFCLHLTWSGNKKSKIMQSVTIMPVFFQVFQIHDFNSKGFIATIPGNFQPFS